MCRKAVDDLAAKRPGLDFATVDLLCLCTQNGDRQLPHTSAPLQHLLGLPPHCAVFDISLGCSGYVYAISLVQAFMEVHGLGRALVLTCDPYSTILDPGDKNTELLFGDAATATLLEQDARFALGKTVFESRGETHTALMKERDGALRMHGQEVFNFAMRHVPDTIARCLAKNALAKEDVDFFFLHQGSKYILESLTRRLGVEQNRVPSNIREIGNTVSSSIPLLLAEYLDDPAVRTALLCGFGVGLGAAATILRRVA